MSGNPPGETRAKKREDRQGGGVNFSLSGGDEHSEPESQTEFWPPVKTVKRAVREGPTAEAPESASTTGAATDARGEAMCVVGGLSMAGEDRHTTNIVWPRIQFSPIIFRYQIQRP
jgi:hypothetical protein